MYYPFKMENKGNLSLKDRIAVNLIVSHYFILNKIIKLFIFLLFTKNNKAEIRRILILRMGSMGDTVTALPSFSAIRNSYPDAEIDLLTNKFQPGKATIEEIMPVDFFRRCFYYEKFVDRSVVNQLKKEKYDLYIELTNYDASIFFELRSMFLAKRIGLKKGMGWYISSDFFFRSTQEKFLLFDTNRTRLLNILKSYGMKFNEPGSLLSENNISVPEYDLLNLIPPQVSSMGLIALVTGTGWEENRWPLEYFKELAIYFSDKGYSVLLIGGNQDFDQCQKLIINNNIFNLCGKFTVLECAAVLKKCIMVISNDTGPMHLSYSVGTSVVAIFSTKDYPGQWYPPENKNNIVIQTPKNQLISNIQVSQVISAANKILYSCSDISVGLP
jgi:ADP-heptose:LPS heptosyltransferase